MQSTSPDNTLNSLSELLARSANAQELARHLFNLSFKQTYTADPALAEMVLACAIPRRFDSKVIGALRDAEDDRETNEKLLTGLLAFTFVLVRKNGGCVYHDNTRDMILEDWLAPEKREQFSQFNQRLVDFYESEYEEARQLEEDFSKVASIVQKASQDRYVQLTALIEKRITDPLLEALYHETLRSAKAGYDFFTRYCEAYERNDRLTICNSLLNATRHYLERLAAQSGQEPLLKWLRYWKARLARQSLAEAEAESILRDLLQQTDNDVKLKLWVLSELGSALQLQYKLREAHTYFKEELVIAEETRADPLNLALSYSRTANLHFFLDEFEQAADKYRAALQSAKDENNVRNQAYAHLNLSNVLSGLGEQTKALDAALEALDLIRIQLREDQDLHQAVILRFMSLMGKRDTFLIETLLKEAEMLRARGDSLEALRFRKEYIDLLRQTGQLSRAEKYLADLRNNSLAHTDAALGIELLFSTALLLEAQGRLVEAIEKYNEIIERSQNGRAALWNHTAALSSRALANLKRSHWLEAISDLETAEQEWQSIGNEKLVALVWVYLAGALRQQGQVVNAQKLLDKAFSFLRNSNPDYVAEYHSTQGDLYRDQARWVEARKHYHQALAIYRSLDQFRYVACELSDLAEIAAQEGEWHKAEQYTAQANVLWRKLSEVAHYQSSLNEADEQNARGLRYFCEGDGERHENLLLARDLFHSASEMAPDNFWYQLNIAYACAELNEWEHAARAVEVALQNGPKWLRSPVLLHRLANYRHKQVEALQVQGDNLFDESKTLEALGKYTNGLNIVGDLVSQDKQKLADLHCRMGLAHFD